MNSLQSVISDKLDKEVLAELMEFMSTVDFIKNLTDINRPRVKDLEKKDGKIVVDITRPHILEDMDFFRPAALHFQEFGRYTTLYPNAQPNSAYYKFWKEETRRCREGLVREDGEWIPGPYYFYLNYSPILKSLVKEGSQRADRIRDFPDVWDGDYLYFHYMEQAREEGKHAGSLKRRGCGFSFKGASDLSRILIVGDSSINKGDVTAFAIASEKEYLIKDGILNKFEANVDWCANNTPWPRLKSKDSLNSMVWEMGFTDSNGITQGTRNSVVGVTTQGDPDKARGKRGVKIYWDEWSKNPNLLKSWIVAMESVQEGDFAFGLMVGAGTGGTEMADFRGAEEMFYNPAGYNIKSLPNVYDKNTGKSSCGYFFPAYLNRLGCYDKNGNSDVTKALIEVLSKRVHIKYNSTDPNTLVQNKSEMAITPQECTMRREGSIFPIQDIKDYLAEIVPDINKFTAPHYVGHLKSNASGVIVWDKQNSHPPLRNYPLRDELDRSGCIEIFEMPHKMQDGTIPPWRYIAGIDPIDSDAGLYTNSLGVIFIFDSWTDRIVAEYSGRPPLASEFYENCVKLLKFYNATANYENNLKGLFQYFDSTKNLRYLCDTPQFLKDMDYAKGIRVGNLLKGTTSNKVINALGRKLQADWLISRAYSPAEEEELDAQGNKVELPHISNLQKIRSIGYLKELVAWNPDDNFDRISAMGMLMILRADREKYELHKFQDKIKTIYDDAWFKRFGGFNSEVKSRLALRRISRNINTL